MKNAEMDREKTYELRSREVNEPPLPARVCWDLTVRDRDGEALLEDVAAEKETAEKIRDAVLAAPGYDPEILPVTVLEDFKDTVLAASQAAREGDVVLLSPACSSFDKFKNFAQRGNCFRKIVEELE